MSARTPRTWRQVALALVVILVLAAIAIVGGAALFFYRHVQSETTTAADAAARIASERARFAGQQPLVRIGADGHAVLAGRPTDAAPAPVVSLRALAYDPENGRLLDVTIPFWLLRLSPDGRISLEPDQSFDLGAERVEVNVSALAALGPGLVLDHADANGVLLLAWTE